MAIRGRQRWTPIPALKQQFDDGRDYISCPECKAFLGDNKPFRPVRNFAMQHMDGREHLTCPKCHALLGRVYWEKATIGDRISRVFCGYMGWKGRAVAAMGFGLAAEILLAIVGMHGYKMSPFEYFTTRSIYFWFLWIPPSLIVFFFLTPATVGPGGAWWWINDK